jgi:TatD DNase family protein
MIDSHCHLADRKFSRDLPDVIRRAKDEGIEMMVAIADSLREAKDCIRIAEESPQVFCTAGVHPHNAKDWKKEDEALLKSLVSHEKVKAIGEIGLDYHYDNSPRDVQKEVFRVQMEMAKELDLPVVVHCRNAIADVRSIIESVGYINLVVHCCTEKWEDVKPLVEQGCLLGFTGIATYPQAADIRRTIEQCPLDQMMIETDAPYLAPVPHRGKRNEPAFVKEVAKLVSDIKGVSFEEVDAATTKNAVEFYHITEINDY